MSYPHITHRSSKFSARELDYYAHSLAPALSSPALLHDDAFAREYTVPDKSFNIGRRVQQYSYHLLSTLMSCGISSNACGT